MKPKLTKFVIPIGVILTIIFASLWYKEGAGRRLKAKAQPQKLISGEAILPPKEGEAIPPQEEAIPVKVFKVHRRDFKDDLHTVGTVRGLTETELKFEANGVIDTINFREGDRIKKGDVIATLKQEDFRTKLKHAKARLAAQQTAYLSSQKKLEINENLFKIGAIIAAKLEEVRLDNETARLQMEVAKVEVELAQSELNKASLKAPKDGVMGTREVEVGEVVTPNTKIGSLIDATDVYVDVGIIEKDIDKVALGQSASLTVDAYPDMGFEGKVDNIFPQVEGKSRTLTTKLRVPNPNSLLLPGMFARVRLTVFERGAAIVIPSLALNKGETGYQVFVVEAPEGSSQGRCSARQVSVGYITTDYALIEEYLEEGELVVTEAQGKLKDGSGVEIIETQERLI